MLLDAYITSFVERQRNVRFSGTLRHTIVSKINISYYKTELNIILKFSTVLLAVSGLQHLIEARQERKCQEVMFGQIRPDIVQRKRLTLKVPMTEHDDTQFFTTDTGKAWIKRAKQIAHNYFLALNRQKRVQIHAVLTSEEMQKLSLDTHVIMETLQRRIKTYAISNTGEGYTCKIELCGLEDGIEQALQPMQETIEKGTRKG